MDWSVIFGDIKLVVLDNKGITVATPLYHAIATAKQGEHHHAIVVADKSPVRLVHILQGELDNYG